MLDGEKTWISNGGIADLYIVFARTGEAPGARGLSAFLLPADTPGLTSPNGSRPSPRTPSPASPSTPSASRPRALIGKPGDGFKIAMSVARRLPLDRRRRRRSASPAAPSTRP